MRKSQNYALRLPERLEERNDPADIDDLTYDLEIIDKELKNREIKTAELDTLKASRTELNAHAAASVLAHPDGSVTDEKIGTRTMGQVQDTLQALLTLLAEQLRALKGTQNWNDAPPLALDEICRKLEECAESSATHTHNYAGSATPGGAADAAVKLQTPRTLTIGKTSRSFDGTADLRWSAEDIGAAGAEVVFGEMHLNGMGAESFQATVYRMGNLVRLAVWMQTLPGGFPPYQFTLGYLDGVPYPPTTISSVAFVADSMQQIGTMGMIPVQVTPGGEVQINPGREGFKYLYFELCYPFE